MGVNLGFFVVDHINHRIIKYTTNGNYIGMWGSFGSGEGQFDNPVYIATHGGFVYVTDRDNHRVEKFDTNGNFIMSWGSYGTGPGQFSRPHGIDVDYNGNVFVIGYDNGRVQSFSSDGEFIDEFGSFGTGVGEFRYPQGCLTVDTSGNLYLYVADNYNHRIQKLSYNSGTPEVILSVTTEGETILSYFGIDNVDNIETPRHTKKVKLDSTSPETVLDISADPVVINNEEYYHAGLVLSMSASDNLSGINDTLYSLTLENGEEKFYSYSVPLEIINDQEGENYCNENYKS